jgi:hypothetical protein
LLNRNFNFWDIRAPPVHVFKLGLKDSHCFRLKHYTLLSWPGRYLRFGVLLGRNQAAMPLEELEQYDSDSGSSNDSPDSEAMPNRKQNSHPNSTSSESEDDWLRKNSTGHLIQTSTRPG